jgi:hypothetical protein
MLDLQSAWISPLFQRVIAFAITSLLGIRIRIIIFSSSLSEIQADITRRENEIQVGIAPEAL